MTDTSSDTSDTANTAKAVKPSAPGSVTLATRVFAALLWVAPRPFRQAHGSEVTQVHRQLCRDAWAERGAWGVALLSGPALADLLGGALLEYAALLLGFVGAWNRSWSMSRIRSSAILVFCAYIAYTLVGLGFMKSNEEVVKSSLPTAHPALGAAYLLVEAAAGLGLLAVLIGGLPIALTALRGALATRRWGVVALFAVPPVALLVWLGYTWLLLNVIFPSHAGTNVHQTLGFGLALSWMALFILAAVASVAAVSAAISRSEVAPRLYRFALGPEAGVVIAMALTTIGVVAWTAQLWMLAPQAVTASNGPLGLNLSLGANLIGHSAVMLAATVVALAGLLRGGEAARRSETALA